MRFRPAAYGTIAGLFLGWVPAAVAQIGLDNFSAQVTLTSDYVYRGLSQSREDPAVQGGFEFAHDSGFFAGVWASSVDFPNNRLRSQPRDLEVNYYLGYDARIGSAWSAGAQLTRYAYPGDDPSFDYDYTELGLLAQFRDLVSGGVHISEGLLGRNQTAVAYELAGRIPVSSRLEALVGVGLFDLDRIVGDSYAYWNVGGSYRIGRFVFDLAYIDTSSEATAIFGDEVAGSRLTVSVTAHLE